MPRPPGHRSDDDLAPEAVAVCAPGADARRRNVVADAEVTIVPAPWAGEIAHGPGGRRPLDDPTLAYLGSLSPAGRAARCGRARARAGRRVRRLLRPAGRAGDRARAGSRALPESWARGPATRPRRRTGRSRRDRRLLPAAAPRTATRPRNTRRRTTRLRMAPPRNSLRHSSRPRSTRRPRRSHSRSPLRPRSSRWRRRASR